MIETKPFDAGRFLTEPEDVDALIADAFASGHAPYIAASIGFAARRHGMTKLASEIGVNRQALYTSLSTDGNPTLETVMKVLCALGFDVQVIRREVP